MRRKAPEARRRPILILPAEADPLGKTSKALPKVFYKDSDLKHSNPELFQSYI